MLEGRVDGAALVLGRAPEVQGEIVHGDGRGKSIGVPTANVKPETELLPKLGVYAGWAERLGDHKRWTAAINVGTNPTFVDGINEGGARGADQTRCRRDQEAHEDAPWIVKSSPS